MSHEDEVRRELLGVRGKIRELEERVDRLIGEVVEGRTEMAEKVDRLAAAAETIDEKVDALDGRVDALDAHLSREIAGVKTLVLELPALLTKAVLDGLAKRPAE